MSPMMYNADKFFKVNLYLIKNFKLNDSKFLSETRISKILKDNIIFFILFKLFLQIVNI